MNWKLLAQIGQGLLVAFLWGAAEALQAGAISGKIIIKAVLLGGTVRAVGWLIQKYGPKSVPPAAIFLLLFSQVAASCSPAKADPITPPGGIHVRFFGDAELESDHNNLMTYIVAPMDTVPLGLSWGAASGRVTGYRVSITATQTNGTWTGLPVFQPVTPPNYTFRPISFNWDSVTFNATVESVDAFGPTGKQSLGSWKMRRRAGAPGPIIVDSSAVPAFSAVLVRPSSVSLAVSGTRQLCAFYEFTDSHVVMKTEDFTACATEYSTFTVAQRTYHLSEQQWADCVLPYACPARWDIRKMEWLQLRVATVADGAAVRSRS